MSEPSKSFTGLKRRKSTPKRVLLLDKVATWIITIGGIGTILAVLSICVFLASVVAPLFLPADLEEVEASRGNSEIGGNWQLAEGGDFAYSYDASGSMALTDLRGNSFEASIPFDSEGATPVAVSPVWENGNFIYGLQNGELQMASISFAVEDAGEDSEAATSAKATHEVFEETRDGEPGARIEVAAASGHPAATYEIALGEAAESESTTPLILVDYVETVSGPAFAGLHEDGTLVFGEIVKKMNLFTGKETVTSDLYIVAEKDDIGAGNNPSWLLLSGLADQLYVVWSDGLLRRYFLTGAEGPQLAEEVQLLPEGETITAFTPLLGRETLLVGSSSGVINAWFKIRDAEAETPDGRLLVKTHTLGAKDAVGSAVSLLAPSQRTRTLVAGFEDGTLNLYNVTTTSKVGGTQMEGTPVIAALDSKEQSLFAIGSDGSVSAWSVDLRHPEASLTALFTPIWYEGYPEPTHTWQSSSGSDDFEPKLGMWPLIFGTLKATVYCMIFAVPLALLAAIYTSEFVRPQIKTRVKPLIEMMASLPSVVLGFLGGLVIAPYVEDNLPAILALFFSIPITYILVSYCWQVLPRHIQLRLLPWRLVLFLITVVPGILSAYLLGPVLEGLIFSGNIKTWLDGQQGSAWPGWFVVMIPLAGMLVAVGVSRYINNILLSKTPYSTQSQFALYNFAKNMCGVVATLLLAGGLAALITAFGFDLRPGFLGTYIQRNAMIVGFAMGFAVIPIIYTIAEDALSAVPAHLRAASLGAGATKWQTATRIVVPTAMSGLFSAIMIGLGRAVGETMIVLMAAGNTPLTEWNIFNGFRTLSANIAVELPEAVKESTHYRTLFLAALVLFILTFIINTVAELVRQHFRKRAKAL